MYIDDMHVGTGEPVLTNVTESVVKYRPVS